jgi:hypothetical protein
MSEARTADPGFAGVSPVDPALLAALDSEKFAPLGEGMQSMFGTRCSALVLVDGETLWLKARLGFTEDTTARAAVLWDEALAADGLFVVADLLHDERFGQGPQVVGGQPVRFFATCVFRSPDRKAIGMLCLADPDPLDLDEEKLRSMTGVVSFIEGELAAARELDRAAEVQRALLPKRVPPLEGYEVAGVCVPAKFVGGDFFDWYAVEGGIAFTMADVMGKGIGSGILAATVRATIRTARHEEDVGLAVDRIADALDADLAVADSFVTLFHARLRAADGMISFVDAGHGLTIIVDAEGRATRLSMNHLPLGTMPQDHRQRREVVLEEGGTLISFSDGVLDLYDGTLDTVERVADIVRSASSAQEIVGEIRRLAQRGAAADDVTAIAIKRLRPSA